MRQRRTQERADATNRRIGISTPAPSGEREHPQAIAGDRTADAIRRYEPGPQILDDSRIFPEIEPAG